MVRSEERGRLDGRTKLFIELLDEALFSGDGVKCFSTSPACAAGLAFCLLLSGFGVAIGSLTSFNTKC